MSFTEKKITEENIFGFSNVNGLKINLKKCSVVVEKLNPEEYLKDGKFNKNKVNLLQNFSF